MQHGGSSPCLCWFVEKHSTANRGLWSRLCHLLGCLRSCNPKEIYMPAVNANGISIEYEDIGDKSAPTILLIMGLGAQLTRWSDNFCNKLASGGFRVVRYDNRD